MFLKPRQLDLRSNKSTTFSENERFGLNGSSWLHWSFKLWPIEHFLSDVPRRLRAGREDTEPDWALALILKPERTTAQAQRRIARRGQRVDVYAAVLRRN